VRFDRCADGRAWRKRPSAPLVRAQGSYALQANLHFLLWVEVNARSIGPNSRTRSGAAIRLLGFDARKRSFRWVPDRGDLVFPCGSLRFEVRVNPLRLAWRRPPARSTAQAVAVEVAPLGNGAAWRAHRRSANRGRTCLECNRGRDHPALRRFGHHARSGHGHGRTARSTAACRSWLACSGICWCCTNTGVGCT
jgi:hypothetical protein